MLTLLRPASSSKLVVSPRAAPPHHLNSPAREPRLATMTTATYLLTLLQLLRGASALELVLGPTPGAYSLRLEGQLWLRSAPIIVTVGHKNYTTADGSLELAANRSSTGCDAIGGFTSTTLQWNAGSTAYVTEFRTYPPPPGDEGGGAVVFDQRFPRGASGTANSGPHAEATLLASFPAWQTNATADELQHSPLAAAAGLPRAWVQFAGHGVPTNAPGCSMGSWPPDGAAEGAQRCQSGGSLDDVGGIRNILCTTSAVPYPRPCSCLACGLHRGGIGAWCGRHPPR
jgi:hypothetical protein